jgi:hypothetical protein
MGYGSRGLGSGLWLVNQRCPLFPIHCRLGSKSDHHHFSTLTVARVTSITTKIRLAGPSQPMSPPQELNPGTPEKVPGILRVPDDSWKETLRLEPGQAYSMAEVLESVTSLCKSRCNAEDDAQDQDKETLAAEAEDVMKQVRDQLGMVGAPIPDEQPADESGGKAEEILNNLKAGAGGGFPRKSTQGKNHTCLHRVWV